MREFSGTRPNLSPLSTGTGTPSAADSVSADDFRQLLQWARNRGVWLDLSSVNRLVLLALAMRTDRRLTCCPRLADLAMDTGLSERAVRRSLADLKHFELLRREAGRGHAPDCFTLRWTRP